MARAGPGRGGTPVPRRWVPRHAGRRHIFAAKARGLHPIPGTPPPNRESGPADRPPVDTVGRTWPGVPMRRILSRLIEWLGGHELAAMLGTLAVGACAWGFVAIAGLVMTGRTRSLDERLLLLLRTPGDPTRPIGPDWFQDTARDITALGSTVTLALATLAVGGFLALD